MKVKKLLVILSILFMTLAMLSIRTYAAEGDTFELQVSSSTSTLNPGDDFTVNLVLDNINVTSGDQGIGAYQAKIVYDTDTLELVSVTSASGWEVSQNEGNIIANTSNGQVVKQRTNTAVISFKVKDDATVGDTNISLESVSGSSGVTVSGTGVEATISIEEESNNDNNTAGDDNTTGNDNTVGGGNSTGNENATGGNNQTGNGSTIGGNNNTPTRNNTSVSGKNVNSSTTANKTLPYAGFTSLVVIAIVISIICAIVFYIKYKRAI